MARPFAIFEPRFCEHCNAELVRRMEPLEQSTGFRSRRFCDRKCRDAFEREQRRTVKVFPVSERLTVTEAYRLASEQCPGVCPIECGFIGYLADNECKEHGRLPTDGGDPCGCWGEVIEEHDAREMAA